MLARWVHYLFIDPIDPIFRAASLECQRVVKQGIIQAWKVGRWQRIIKKVHKDFSLFKFTVDVLPVCQSVNLSPCVYVGCLIH